MQPFSGEHSYNSGIGFIGRIKSEHIAVGAVLQLFGRDADTLDLEFFRLANVICVQPLKAAGKDSIDLLRFQGRHRITVAVPCRGALSAEGNERDNRMVVVIFYFSPSSLPIGSTPSSPILSSVALLKAAVSSVS